MGQLEDGKGSGRKAGVNSTNRLDVSAKTEDRIFYNSRDKEKSFSVYGRRNFAAGGTDENILSLTYTGNDKLFIKDIMFSTNSANAKIEIYFDASSISGGATIIPLNINRGAALLSETTCLHGGNLLTGTVTSANEFFDVRLNKSSFLRDFHSALILSRNSNIFILGEVENSGEKIRVMVYFYEDST